jgi:hypothetical protein
LCFSAIGMVSKRNGFAFVIGIAVIIMSTSFLMEYMQKYAQFEAILLPTRNPTIQNEVNNIVSASEKPEPIESKAPISAPNMQDSILKPAQKFLLTVCTMVKDEAAYIVEWIEFLRLQGAERFIIYDDDSTDNITFLNDLYSQTFPESYVQVIPKIKLSQQGACFQHCVQTFGKDSTWILIADVDEFVYSPTYGTLANMLAELPNIEAQQKRQVDVIKAECTRYSTFGADGASQQNRFQYVLERRPDGKVEYRNGCGLQAITSHTRRGPDDRLSQAEVPLKLELDKPENGCENVKGWNVCSHGLLVFSEMRWEGGRGVFVVCLLVSCIMIVIGGCATASQHD